MVHETLQSYGLGLNNISKNDRVDTLGHVDQSDMSLIFPFIHFSLVHDLQRNPVEFPPEG